jgi:uncharacterized protein with HEPN domain
MPRSTVACLADILDACAAVEDVLDDLDLETYVRTRSVRSSVEREFIIIGEAVSVLGRTDPESFSRISHARLIIGLRNVLTHDYPAVDEETLYGVARSDLPVLRSECAALLETLGDAR